MPGLISVASKLYGAKRAGDRQAAEEERLRQEQERRRQQEDADRARAEEEAEIRRALLLAQLGQSGIVRNDAREETEVGGLPETSTMRVRPEERTTRMRLPDVPDLITQEGPATRIEDLKGRTDPAAYASMRPTGTLHDTDEEADAAAERAPQPGDIRTRVGGRESMRVQGLPGERVADPERYTELGKTGYSLDRRPAQILEQRTRAQAEQKLSQRKAALRAKHPERYGKMGDAELAGIASDDDAYREALKDVRHPAPATLQTRDGIVQWNEKTGRFEPTGMQPSPRATGGSSAPPEKDERDALQDRINLITTQINQVQKAIEDEPFLADRDTSPDAVAQREAGRRLRERLETLRRDQAQLTQQLEKFSGPTIASAAPPEGLDLSAAAKASAVEREKADIAYQRIAKGEATLEQAMSSAYLTPAMKAIIWQRVNGGR